MANFEIAPGRYVGDNYPCFIVAEIGQNHQGDIEVAKKLIMCAKECGVDCVKFQKSDLCSRFTKEVLSRPYKSPNSWGDTYGEHREKIELSEDCFRCLYEFSSSLEILFTASGMDKTYKSMFPSAVIGYSGHELGTEISVAAVVAGAKIIERHITLDHSLKGSDHVASLDPIQLKKLVSDIKTVETAMGSFRKFIQPGEISCYEKLGKTIVASKFLQAGTIIDEDKITVKVAEKKKFDPIFFYDLIGKTLKRSYCKDETILCEDLC